MAVLFKKVCFIGMGLIASSLARVMRREAMAERIVGVARSEKTRRTALGLGVVDEMTDDAAAAVADADLVVLCTPVGAFESVMRKIAPFLKKGCIVSDVGSVKKHVVDVVSPLIPPDVVFVPAHPVAGTEKSGPENGFDTLFSGRWCILTPCERSTSDAVALIRAVWEKAGMNVEEMTPQTHDAVMAVVSHVPHLIAYAFVHAADTAQNEDKRDMIRFSAGGFRDFTRIAASDPVMWRDIFLENADAVLKMLDGFTDDLNALRRAIVDGDGDFLEKTFARSRAVRQKVVDARQEQPENEKRLLQKR